MKKDSVVRLLDRIVFILICLYAGTICLAPHIHFANIAFGIALIRICLQRPCMKVKTYHLQFVGVFLIALLCSVFFNGVNAEYGKNLMYYRSNFLSPLMLGLAVIWIGFSEKKIQIFFALAIASLFINDFVVICQGLQGELRPAGLAGSCMFLGGMFLFLCPLLLGLFWSAELEKNKKFHFCIGVILVFSLVAAIYNATRIAWIGISFLGIILFFLLQQEKKKYVFKFILILALGMMVFLSNAGLQNRLTSIVNMQNTSNSERILMWSSAWHMIEDHPIVGVGVGNYKDQFQEIYRLKNSTHTDQIHPHNVIFSIFSQAGIIGGLAYLAMIIYFLYESFCMWKRAKSLVALLFFSILLGYLINGLTDCNFGGPFLTPLNDFYYFMLACYLILSGNVHYSQKK